LADPHLIGDLPELGADRILDLLADGLERLGRRQARADATYDQIERLRQEGCELLHPPRDPTLQREVRQADAERQPQRGADQERKVQREAHRERRQDAGSETDQQKIPDLELPAAAFQTQTHDADVRHQPLDQAVEARDRAVARVAAHALDRGRLAAGADAAPARARLQPLQTLAQAALVLLEQGQPQGRDHAHDDQTGAEDGRRDQVRIAGDLLQQRAHVIIACWSARSSPK
jgi:hypothetical protein